MDCVSGPLGLANAPDTVVDKNCIKKFHVTACAQADSSLVQWLVKQLPCSSGPSSMLRSMMLPGPCAACIVQFFQGQRPQMACPLCPGQGEGQGRLGHCVHTSFPLAIRITWTHRQASTPASCAGQEHPELYYSSTCHAITQGLKP